MAEWSKAVDSRPTIFGCVGSNPTGSIYIYYNKPTAIFINKLEQSIEFTGSNPVYLNDSMQVVKACS